jgi:hypothetical protein
MSHTMVIDNDGEKGVEFFIYAFKSVDSPRTHHDLSK